MKQLEGKAVALASLQRQTPHPEYSRALAADMDDFALQAMELVSRVRHDIEAVDKLEACYVEWVEEQIETMGASYVVLRLLAMGLLPQATIAMPEGGQGSEETPQKRQRARRLLLAAPFL